MLDQQNHQPKDLEIFNLIEQENQRQANGLEMIASENYASLDVMQACGSILTNKYAEGYPNKRYYGGCHVVDQIETLAIERAKELFQVGFANVQPHSGSQANMAVFLAALKQGDTILGMDLSHGGHLTHGSPVNFSGILYKGASYKLDAETGLINYDTILKTALEVKPKLIIAGYSAYSRHLDFAKFKEIAVEVNAELLVDMAHFSGIVAAGLHQSPVPFADYMTTTTHKTLRGPRGGIILTSSEEKAKLVNSKIFPGIQGGPLEHIIAGKAIAFKEALRPDFKIYMQQVLDNAKALSEYLMAEGFHLVTGGTDNHLMLIDLSLSRGTEALTGKIAEAILDQAGITVNKNTVPNEKRSPFVTSGIRIGTPALTTRGMKIPEMKQISKWITDVLKQPENTDLHLKIQQQVKELCQNFPIYR
ncbi:MAG: serine hydroxymethyltransferase [Moraxellaceae bacterium]|nr:serine hydroxymethyltransferase [Pseudobdellovibrionaceae bacterium]